MEQQEQYKSLRMTVLMTPNMANFSGNVHGGAMLNLLDQVAYACASRYSGSYVVTVSVDQVFFHRPVHVGELVTFLSSVNYTGRTSMEIGVRAVSENIRLRTERHVMTCYFTMVAVNDAGMPMPVPQLQITSPTEQRRYNGAVLRRQLRREVDRRIEDIRQQGFNEMQRAHPEES
ncbi:MAG: acyl-CoA thioesterase [Chloroflexaceae bacterium]|nr:acyl-CoA thioesterase [Chloroflexaceae bacterium]